MGVNHFLQALPVEVLSNHILMHCRDLLTSMQFRLVCKQWESTTIPIVKKLWQELFQNASCGFLSSIPRGPITIDHFPKEIVNGDVDALTLREFKIFNGILRGIAKEKKIEMDSEQWFILHPQIVELQEKARQVESDDALQKCWPEMRTALKRMVDDEIVFLDKEHVTVQEIRNFLNDPDNSPMIESVYALNLSKLGLKTIPSEIERFSKVYDLDY